MSLVSGCREYSLTHGLFSCQAVVVGVSGGADSMCLLDILSSVFACGPEHSGEFFPGIAAAHINHGLRGKASDLDEELVRRFCESRKIPFYSAKVDVSLMAQEGGTGLEEAGRHARYSFFQEIAQKISPAGETVYIATAHHREDQAETILMNLFRGSGPDGLCGMRPKNQDVIRPLLFASKREILTHLQENEIEYSEDASNQENTYTRNRWRNQILPLIADVSRKDPMIPLLLTSEFLSVDRDYFDEQVSRIFYKHMITGGNGTRGIPCVIFRGEHRAIASRLVRYLYTDCFQAGTDLTYAHVTSILSLAEDGPGGRRIALTRGRIAYISGGVLFFEDLSDLHRGHERTWMTKNGFLLLSENDDAGEVSLLDSADLRSRVVAILKTSFQVETILVENPMQVVYNSRTWYCTRENLEGAVIRTRRKGDWFSSAGSNGGKPLRRFLTDRKIPSFIRDRMILVARDSQVLWIPGMGHAEGFVDEISGRKFDPSCLIAGDGAIGNCGRQIFRITIHDNSNREEQ